MIRLHVLGPLRASRGVHPLTLPGPRHRAVLARLLVARGAVVPVDRIIEDLWGHDQPSQAMASIQTFVARLRRTLEPDRPPRSPGRLLITSPPGYAVQLDPDCVDAWRFERLVDGVRSLPDDAARRQLDEALGLWQGAAFAEFADESWVRSEAGRLAELRLHAVELWADASVRTGAAAKAAAVLEAHVAAEPLRENGWIGLAQALYAAGRQADALAALRRARAVFREELGVDPGPALARIEADILAHAAHLTPVRPPGHAPEARPSDVFAGRANELDALVQRIGTGGAAVVCGPPGAGKTRLLTELANRLDDENVYVASGLFRRSDGLPPGWAVAELVRKVAADYPPTSAMAGRLGWVLSDDADVHPDPVAGRFRIHRAVRDYLVDVGRHVPLVLVLDDLHWADEESLAILDTVLGPDGVTGLVVLAYRATDTTEPVNLFVEGLAARLPLRLQLDGLTASAVGAVLKSACRTSLTPETVALIAERTGGNPFFVHEIARLVDTADVDAALSAVPAGVRDVLRQRIGLLPEIARTVLSYCAVLDRGVDLAILIELTEAAEDVVLDAVEASLTLGLLAEGGRSQVEFPHALVRDAVYTSISPLRRSRMHAHTAAVIERVRPHDVDALAYHYEATSNPDLSKQVTRYSRLAAHSAERRYCYREAVVLWRRALAAHDSMRNCPVERLELLLDLVRALALANDTAAARTLRGETLTAAEATGDPELIARTIAAFDVPTFWTTRPYGEVDTRLLDLTARTLDRLPPGHSVARCRLLISTAFELDGEDDHRGRHAARDALAMARHLDDPYLMMMALSSSSLQNYWIGSLAYRQTIGAELIDLGHRHNLIHAELLGRVAVANGHGSRGEYAMADRHMEVVERVAREHDQHMALAITSSYRALTHIIAGDLDSALTRYSEAARFVYRSRTWSENADYTTGTTAIAFLATGHGGELLDVWHANSLDAAPYPELYALALAHAGRVDEAIIAAGEPQPIRKDYFWDIFWSIRAKLGILLADRTRIDSAYDTLLPYSHLIAGGGTYVMTLGPIAHILGDLALARGDTAAARSHYQQAMDLARRSGSAYWEQAVHASRALLGSHDAAV